MEYGGGAPGSSMPQWLHAALSDNDAKTQRMLNLVQCDWETFPERVERYYRRAPELAEMLKDWHRYYCYLAQKHGELGFLYDKVTAVQADSCPEDPDLTVETGELDHLNCATDGSPGTVRHEVAGETKEREEIENGGKASGSSESQWLHATLSDIDAKMQCMLNLIEGDGGTFAERAERYYRRRSEFAEMLKDWHGCYCYSAQKHYVLWSRYVQVTTVQAKCYPEDQDVTVETGELDHLNCTTDGSPGTACPKVAGKTKEREEIENGGIASGSSMSQWLHATLSDSDAKTHHMLNLIEGNWETLAERTERYYRRRPELAEMLNDRHRSYCYLAQKHNELWSHYVQVTTGQANSYPEDPDLTVETGELDHVNCATNGSLGAACLKVSRETNERGEIDKKSEIGQMTTKQLVKMLMPMQAVVLGRAREAMAAELLRRNEEKGAKIKKLVSLIKRLRNENAELKNRLSAREVGAQREQEPEESRLSKLKGFILEKFFL